MEEQRAKEALVLAQNKHKLIKWEGERERARTMQRLQCYSERRVQQGEPRLNPWQWRAVVEKKAHRVRIWKIFETSNSRVVCGSILLLKERRRRGFEMMPHGSLIFFFGLNFCTISLNKTKINFLSRLEGYSLEASFFFLSLIFFFDFVLVEPV